MKDKNVKSPPPTETAKKQFECCERVFLNEQGYRIHRGQSHGTGKRSKRGAIRAPVAVPIVMKYCCHCGERLPNAVIA